MATKKVLIATGRPLSESRQNTEVLDLNNEDAVCHNLPPFPEEIRSATGSVIQGQPLVCGGYDKDWNAKEDCWTLEKSRTSWRRLTTMTSKRTTAASVPVNNTYLWILGGYDGDGPTKSTEYVDLEGNSKTGPDMPLPISSHAIVALENSTYFLIGGRTDDDQHSEKTYYFSEETQQWSQGPNLKQGRAIHTAGLIIDEVTAERYTIVAGGIGDGWSTLDSTEILYPGATEWQQGKHSNNLKGDVDFDAMAVVPKPRAIAQ